MAYTKTILDAEKSAQEMIDAAHKDAQNTIDAARKKQSQDLMELEVIMKDSRAQKVQEQKTSLVSLYKDILKKGDEQSSKISQAAQNNFNAVVEMVLKSISQK